MGQETKVIIFDKAREKVQRSARFLCVGYSVGNVIYVADTIPVVDVIPQRSIDLVELDAGFTTQQGIMDTILTPLGLSVVASTESLSCDKILLRVSRHGEDGVVFQSDTGECLLEVVQENPIRSMMTFSACTSGIRLPYSRFSPEIVEAFVKDLEEGAVAVSQSSTEGNKAFDVMKRSQCMAPACPPSLHISKENAGKPTTWTTFLLDVACLVSKKESAKLPSSDILAQLQYGVRRMLTLARSGRYGPSYHFGSFFFWPEEIEFPIYMVYPVKNLSEDDNNDAIVWRRAVQVALGLGTQRPYLRVANALSFSIDESNDISLQQQQHTRLKNVDKGLPSLNIGGNPVKRIKGSYEYYHYLQDKVDDSGWGCAYRSLQTICSWIKLQGYCKREPPSHREIQATLVALGDKGKHFIGSKNWIGAIEIGYVLDSLYNIESKIITVADGSNMASVAREIGQHFDTQGTPIMIGGGVLAYTLLGIDYDENTGDCAFLILDPHYTGLDDLGKIQKGKWVAWKKVGDKATAGGDLFVSGSFYNLLCPQCPRII